MKKNLWLNVFGGNTEGDLQRIWSQILQSLTESQEVSHVRGGGSWWWENEGLMTQQCWEDQLNIEKLISFWRLLQVFTVFLDMTPRTAPCFLNLSGHGVIISDEKSLVTNHMQDSHWKQPS